MMLKKGMKGPNVSELKALLAKVGYYLDDRGIHHEVFGPKVLAAVRDFQKKNSLVVDGIVGKVTWETLKSKSTGVAVTPDTKISADMGETPWMDFLLRNLNQKEIPGTKANPFIADLFKYTSLRGTKLALSDETAWCAALVCAALGKTGYEHVNSASARECEKIGVESEIRYGAIATVPRKGGSGRHVFFIYAHNRKAGTVVGLGGNQSNALNKRTFKVKDLKAVRWPIKMKKA